MAIWEKRLNQLNTKLKYIVRYILEFVKLITNSREPGVYYVNN